MSAPTATTGRPRPSRPTTRSACGPASTPRRRKIYDYEGTEPANTAARRISLDQRCAGRYFRAQLRRVDRTRRSSPGGDSDVLACTTPVLDKLTDKDYPPYDLDYPDVERAEGVRRRIEELSTTPARMPQLLIVRMGNDHTSGTTPGKIAPLSAVADNDQGVGMLVEAVSKSASGMRLRSSSLKTMRRMVLITSIRIARRHS